MLKSYIELVANGIYNSVIIGDNVLKPKQQKKKKKNKISILFGFIIGFLVSYIIFKNIFIALVFGLLVGVSPTETETIISKKRKKEKE